MQTLPIITAAPPATSAQASAPVDNNAAAPAEAFGKVLARQRANSDAQDKTQSSTSPTTAATEVAGDETQVVAADVVSTLPADMLAALLPAGNSANGKPADDKSSAHKAAAKAVAPDTVSALPSDMLAALATAPVTIQNAVADADAGQQAAVSAMQDDLQQSGDLSRALGKLTAQPVAGQNTEASRASAAGLPATTSPGVANAAKPDSFAAMMGALGKDAANTAQVASEAQMIAAAAPDSATLLNQTQGIAATPVAANPNAPAQLSVNTPITQDTWGEEFNQKITWMATQHNQTAELHLNPPQLGPMDVVLSVSGDQATALFTSPHAAVREAIEQALPKLRDMLAENGIMLGNATVSDQTPKEQQQAWQAEQRQKGDSSTGGKAGSEIQTVGMLAGNASGASGRRHQGMVDTFA